MALTPRSVWRYFKVDGVPSSGKHDPIKAEIIQLLEQLFGVSRGGWVVAQTRAALLSVTPEDENDGGVVLDDPNPAYNGNYSRVAGVWDFGRGFPDTFAKVTLAGSGTSQAGAVNTGVNPATTEVFFAKVTTPNTGPMTLSIGGGPARSVRNLAGNALTAGEWTGMVMFYLNDANQYQLLIDAGAAESASQSATAAGDQADRSETEADRSQANADDAAAFAGFRDFSDLSTLRSNTSLAYGAGASQVEAGDIIRTRREGFSVVVALSGASDHDDETDGGVKVYAEPRSEGVPVEAFGPTADGVTDDSHAFIKAQQVAIDRGYNTIISPGRTYACEAGAEGYAFEILDGVTWKSGGTRLVHSDDTKTIVRVNERKDWSILDRLFLDGLLTSAGDSGERGLHVTGGRRYRVEGVTANNFLGDAIKIDGTNNAPTDPDGNRGDRGQWSDCSALRSTRGLVIAEGAGGEYNTFSNFTAAGNIKGGIIDAGNNMFHGGNFVDNIEDGLILKGVGGNSGHGGFFGTNFNHNSNSNMKAENVLNGQSFIGCHFYGDKDGGAPPMPSSKGNIWLLGSRGVTIQGGIIDGWIYNDLGSGSGMNYIIDNFEPEGGNGIALNTNIGGLGQLFFGRNYSAAGPHPLNDAAPVFVSATRGGSPQSVSAGATTLVFNSAARNKQGALNTSTGVITVQVAGAYEVATLCTFTAASGLVNGYLAVVVNGSTVGFIPMMAISGTIGVASGTIRLIMAAGDTLELRSTITGVTPVLATDTSSLSIAIMG